MTALAITTLLLGSPLHAQDSEHQRQGLWGGLGFGWGRLDCFDCSGASFGGWGAVGRIGGTISPSLRLAAATNSWNRSHAGNQLQASSLEFQAHWFPAAGQAFLYGGAGLGAFYADWDVDDVNAALSAGAGYSFDLGSSRKVALVPEISITMLTSRAKTYFLQASLGFFWN